MTYQHDFVVISIAANTKIIKSWVYNTVLTNVWHILPVQHSLFHSSFIITNNLRTKLMMIKSKLTNRTVGRSFQYLWYSIENDWTKSLFLSISVFGNNILCLFLSFGVSDNNIILVWSNDYKITTLQWICLNVTLNPRDGPCFLTWMISAIHSIQYYFLQGLR
jgi:hypothetical protein